MSIDNHISDNMIIVVAVPRSFPICQAFGIMFREDILDHGPRTRSVLGRKGIPEPEAEGSVDKHAPTPCARRLRWQFKVSIDREESKRRPCMDCIYILHVKETSSAHQDRSSRNKPISCSQQTGLIKQALRLSYISEMNDVVRVASRKNIPFTGRWLGPNPSQDLHRDYRDRQSHHQPN